VAIKLITGTAASAEALIDANGNIYVTDGLPEHPAAGGYYTCCGGPTGIVAAGLAADVNLMTARFSAGSSRRAYVTKYRFIMSPATLGAAAGVAGQIALQRFATATPTGGTARTPNEQHEAEATATDMTDIRDQATALTVTSVTFGTEIARTVVPLFVASAGSFEWIYEPNYPTVLTPGDGITLRTRVALAATQTWVFSWTMHWYEKAVVV
jgi:hypothetical protein